MNIWKKEYQSAGDLQTFSKFQERLNLRRETRRLNNQSFHPKAITPRK